MSAPLGIRRARDLLHDAPNGYAHADDFGRARRIHARFLLRNDRLEDTHHVHLLGVGRGDRRRLFLPAGRPAARCRSLVVAVQSAVHRHRVPRRRSEVSGSQGHSGDSQSSLRRNVPKRHARGAHQSSQNRRHGADCISRVPLLPLHGSIEFRLFERTTPSGRQVPGRNAETPLLKPAAKPGRFRSDVTRHVFMSRY